MVLVRLILGAVTASLLCGCGTMANLEGRRLPLISMPGQERPKVFGGVQKDFDWATTVRDPITVMPLNLLFVADLPISLVADIVTMPEVRREQIKWDDTRSADIVKPQPPNPDAPSESN